MRRLIARVIVLLMVCVGAARAEEVDETVTVVKTVLKWSDAVRSGDYATAEELTNFSRISRRFLHARLAYIRFEMHCGSFKSRGFWKLPPSDPGLLWFGNNMEETQAAFLVAAKRKPEELLFKEHSNVSGAVSFDKAVNGQATHDGCLFLSKVVGGWHIDFDGHYDDGCWRISEAWAPVFQAACDNAVNELMADESLRKRFGLGGTANGVEVCDWFRAHIRAATINAQKGADAREAFGGICLSLLVDARSDLSPWCWDGEVLEAVRRSTAFMTEVETFTLLAQQFVVKTMVDTRKPYEIKPTLPGPRRAPSEYMKEDALSTFGQIDVEAGRAVNRIQSGLGDTYSIVDNDAKAVYPLLVGDSTKTSAVLAKKEGKWVLIKPFQFGGVNPADCVVEADPRAMELYTQALRASRRFIFQNPKWSLWSQDVNAYIHEVFDEPYAKVVQARAVADRERRRRELSGEVDAPTTQAAFVVVIPDEPCPFAVGQRWQWKSVVNGRSLDFPFEVKAIDRGSDSRFMLSVSSSGNERSEWTLSIIDESDGSESFLLALPTKEKAEKKVELRRTKYRELSGRMVLSEGAGNVTLTRQ